MAVGGVAARGVHHSEGWLSGHVWLQWLPQGMMSMSMLVPVGCSTASESSLSLLAARDLHLAFRWPTFLHL